MDANDFWDRDKWENGYTLEEPSEPIFLKLEADIFDELEKDVMIQYDEIKKEPQDESKIEEEVVKDQDDLNESNFVYTLSAPTSGFARQNEGTRTYLNKDQQYVLLFEYVPRSSPEYTPQIRSLISLQFSIGDQREEAYANKYWKLWTSRQVNRDFQALKVFSKDDYCNPLEIQEVSRNAVSVKWPPNSTQVLVFVAVRCLSTDFTNQKGVKGIPLYLQIDTYVNEEAKERAAAQIKTFCEKGADRKNKDEARRLRSQTVPYTCQMAKEKTIFSRSKDLTANPFLFNEDNGDFHFEDLDWPDRKLKNPPRSVCGASKAKRGRKSGRNVKVNPSPLFIHVKQKNEMVYTPLYVTPTNLTGLSEAITKKFHIPSNQLRKFFLKPVDLDMIPLTETLGELVCEHRSKFFTLEARLIEEESESQNSSKDVKSLEVYDLYFWEYQP